MASILFPKQNSYPDPKLHVSTGHLPPYIHPSQPPTKKSPWRQITQTPYIHTTTMVLPTSLYDIIWSKLTSTDNNNNNITQPSYAKLFLKLEDILTGDFFTTYIKTPGRNVSMLSEGIPGVDDVFSLRNGMLRLDLGKETYQRAGLQGKALKTSGARKHVKEYFRVEFDLRDPGMLGGKKGFERLLSAARNVLDGGRMWVFRDSSDTNIKDAATLSKHHAQLITMTPQIRDVHDISIPAFLSQLQHPHQPSNPPSIETLDDFYELTEWLDLLSLDSPRVCQPNDNVDPYICRYTPPVPNTSSSSDTKPIDLKCIEWTGLMDPSWVTGLLVEIIKQSRMSGTKKKDWIAVSVTGHRTDATGRVDGYMILLSPDGISPDNPESREAGENETGMHVDVDPSVTGDGNMDVGVGDDDDDETQGNEHATDDDDANGTSDAAAGGGTVGIEASSSHNTSGLRRFTCFQFVDS